MDEDIVKSFPYKEFREGQYDAIKASIDYFRSGGKFMCIDGKTGCGKSIINYTILKTMPERSVYLAPQKMLQDQIGNENWDDATILKGSSGYACTYCQDYGETRYKCNYEGDDVETCNNSSQSESFDKTTDAIRSELVREFSSGVNLEYRTAYSSVIDFDNKIDLYIDYYRKNASELAEYSKKYEPLTSNFDDSVEGIMYGDIGCTMGSRECPKKAAVMNTYVSKVCVLNPDVMYYNNMYNKRSPFNKIGTLAIDEAHGIEGVVDRIFGSSISLTVMKEVYGIDLFYLVDEDISRSLEMFYSDDLDSPYFNVSMLSNIYATLKHLSKFKGILSIYDMLSSSYLANGKPRYIKQFKVEFSKKGISGFHKLLLEAYNFDESEAEEYFDKATKGGNVDDIIESIKDYIGGNMYQMQKERLFGYKLDADIINQMKYVHENVVVSDHLLYLKRMLDDFFVKLSSLGESAKSFVFSKEEYKNGNGVHDELIKSDNSLTEGVSAKIVILDKGAIMNKFFYSKAENVLLSTGTWIYPDSMKKALGVSKAEMHIIKSTFNPKGRPIFLIKDDSVMNFSERVSGDYYNGYKYDTEAGKKQITDSIIKLTKSIRDGFKKTSGENINIIIHTNSFKISKILAESADTPSNFKFHFPYAMKIENQYGSFVDRYEKEEFMTMIKNSKDSGLVFISPSITEGVDFKHKIARAQIIMKHPMPNIMSPYIQAILGKTNLKDVPIDKDIYSRLTMTTLIQEYGRVMRDESDWGATFIYDQKCIDVLAGYIKSPYEVSRANIGYLIDGIAFRRISGGKFRLIRPSFNLDY